MSHAIVEFNQELRYADTASCKAKRKNLSIS